MPATIPTADSGAPATSVRLRTDMFDRLAAGHGANTEVARARLIGCDRATLYRMRTGQGEPSVSRAMHIALVLGVRVEDLFERVDDADGQESYE